jgi:hypothetical protein
MSINTFEHYNYFTNGHPSDDGDNLANEQLGEQIK